MGWEFPALFFVAFVPYNYFQYCASGCANSILGNVSLVKKVAFPRQILPISVIFTHLIDFGAQFGLLVLILAFFPHPGRVLGPTLLWLPLVLAVHLGLCVGFGFLVSALHVKFRDVRYLVESLFVVLFWASPVIYDTARVEACGGWVPWLYHLNPLAGIIQAYRAVLFYGTSPDPLYFGMATLITLVLGAVGVRVFWIHERSFADLI
jgi:ABC-type polysaccharide/polyol phosphate export permease